MWVIGLLLSFPVAAQNLSLNTSVLEDAQQVRLTWSVKGQQESSLKYYVYRAQNGGSRQLLTPKGVDGTSYDDTEAQAGIPYLYSVRGVSSNGRVYQSAALYGVRGTLPQPQVEVLPGVQNKVLLRMKNRPSYLKVNVSVSRPYYQPQYRLKEAYSSLYGNHVVNEKSLIPFNYEDSLCYTVNPNRRYTANSFVCKNAGWDEISDGGATPGINRYTVQYSFILPNGRERLSAFSVVKGFRNLTDREFLDEVLMTVERSQYKLDLIHRGGTAPNGFDSTEDDTKGDNESFEKDPKNPPKGWLYYDCEFSLLKMIADVTLIYQDYQDYDLILTTDKSRMHRSLVGPEKITNINDTKVGQLLGVVLVSGIYNGEVEFRLSIGNRSEKPNYKSDSPLYSPEQMERFHYSGKKGPGSKEGDTGNGSYYVVRQKKNGEVISQSVFPWDYDRNQVDRRLLRLKK